MDCAGPTVKNNFPLVNRTVPRDFTGMDKTGIQQAVEAVGDQSKLAKLLGVAPQAVQGWVDKGYAPVGRARQIGMVTGVDHRTLVDPVIRDLFA